MSAVVELRGVAKSFGSTPALAAASLAVQAGEVHALVGANGSGKTTLIEILLGTQSADRGSGLIGGTAVDLCRRDPARGRSLGLRAVHQEPALFTDLPIWVNLAADRIGEAWTTPRQRRSLHREAAAQLRNVGVDADPRTPLHRLRPAERFLVAIARAMPGDEEPPVLLALDEPTASLDPHEARSLLDSVRALAAKGSAVLLVTHRMSELVTCADRVTALRNGRTVARFDRVPSQGELLVTIAGEEPPAIGGAPAVAAAADSSGPGLELVGISAGGALDVSLSVGRGEIVGLAGLRGAGRSSILRAAFGDLPIRRGEIRVRGRAVRLRTPGDGIAAGIAFVGEDRRHSGVFAELDLAANLRASALARRRALTLIPRRGEHRRAAAAIARYGIVGRSGAAAGTLSGGNQQKALLARWLDGNPTVLLLDEPTQGVDIAARAALHDDIRNAARGGTAVLFASSDNDELHSLADRVIAVDRGRVTTEPDLDLDEVLP